MLSRFLSLFPLKHLRKSFPHPVYYLVNRESTCKICIRSIVLRDKDEGLVTSTLDHYPLFPGQVQILLHIVAELRGTNDDHSTSTL